MCKHKQTIYVCNITSDITLEFFTEKMYHLIVKNDFNLLETLIKSNVYNHLMKLNVIINNNCFTFTYNGNFSLIAFKKTQIKIYCWEILN